MEGSLDESIEALEKAVEITEKLKKEPKKKV